MKNQELKFEIVQHIATISNEDDTYRKELNLVSWNGRAAKLDLRSWDEAHKRPSKGLTLSNEEAARLRDALEEWAWK